MKLNSNEYQAILENAILDYLEDQADKNLITLEKAQEIARFTSVHVFITNNPDELSENTELLKEKFPELKQPIEDAIADYEELQKYAIA